MVEKENKTGLTAIIMNVENHDFNTQYRALTIPEGGTFSVTVKEYQDEKERITDKIKIIKGKIKSIEKDAAIKEQTSRNEANERLRSGDKKWIEKETYDGKEMTFAEVSYRENLRIASAKTKHLLTSENTKLTDLNKSLKDLETTYSKIAWAWNLAKKRTHRPNGKHEGISTGHTIKNMTLGSHVYGGGFAWIEPFWDEKDSNPTGSTKNGLYIHTKSDNPKPIIAEWYAKDEAGNPIKLTNPVKAGSKVELHIYTKSMYGHNIGVELKGNGKILPANSYSVGITITSKNGKTIPNDTPPKPEISESQNLFLTEVDIHDCTDANSAKPPDEAITGNLTDDLGNDRDGKRSSIKHVQKAILYVNIDPIWTFGINGLIEVIPIIHSTIGRTELQKSSLQIMGNSFTEMIQIEGNMPVFVDNVETNFEAFHHCRYDEIKGIAFRGEEKIQDVTLFTSTKNSLSNIIDFPIVAGCIQAKAKITITTDADTNECIYVMNENLIHTDHVMDIRDLAPYIQQHYGKAQGKYRWLDTKTELANNNISTAGDAKSHNSNDQNDGDLQDTTNISQSLNVKSIIGIKTQKSYKVLEGYEPFTLFATDTNLDLEVGYDYTFRGTKDPLIGLFYCIWPNNSNIVQNLPLKLSTCAYQKQVNIQVYPDVKWTLQLAFNVDEDKFSEIQTTYHKKHNLTQYAAEDTIKSLKKRKKGGLSPHQKSQLSTAEQIKKDSEKAIKNKPGVYENAKKVFDCEVSLIAEFDRPFAELEVSAAFDDIKEFLQKIMQIKEKAEDIIGGTDNQAIVSSPKKHENRFNRMESILANKKKQQLCSFEFIPPSIGLSLSWYAEHLKTSSKPEMGTMIEGVIKAEPIFGFEYSIDLLTLLGNAHPIAKAIVLIIKALDTIAGDDFDIIFKFVVSGGFSLEGKGAINTASGETNFNKAALSKDEDDTPFKIGGTIKFDLTFSVIIKGNYKTYAFGDYDIYGKVVLNATTGITCEGVTKASSENGIYIEPEIKFLGLIINAQVDLGVVVPKEESGGKVSNSKNQPENEYGIHYKNGIELVVMDPFEWEMNGKDGKPNWRIPIVKPRK